MAFKRIGYVEPEEEPQKRFRKIDPSTDSRYHQGKTESVLSAGSKGFIRGLSDLGEMFGGEDTTSEILRDVYGANPEQLEEMKAQRNQIGSESLDKALPSQEGFLESMAERGGRMLPGFAVGPGGTAAKLAGIGGGALAGQLAEDSGAGPWGQMAAEVLGSALGGSVSGRLRPRAGSRQEELVNTARGHGLSEREIAPAIQSNRKIGLLSPIAHRGEGTVGRIAESRTAIARIYNNLAASPAGQQVRSTQELTGLLNDLSQELNTLPRAVRDLIARDAQDLIHGPGNAASIMDFYRDVNYHIGRGNGHLGGVRRVLENHLTNFLGEDFTAANELFGNVRRLGIRVRPDLVSHFHDFRNAANLSEAIVKQDKKGIGRAITEILSRFTASKLLTSPYLQHFPRKLLDSAIRGSPESAKKFLSIYLNKKEKEED